MDIDPKITGIAVSAFAIDDFEKPNRSIWEKFKCSWVNFASEIEGEQGQN